MSAAASPTQVLDLSIDVSAARHQMQEPEPELHAQPSTLSGAPRVVLLGLPLSGKSSIQKVLFYNMPPEETRHLESAHIVERSAIANSDFVQFETWDCPGTIDLLGADCEALLVGCDTLVFVIDAQSTPYTEALAYLVQAVEMASQASPETNLQVFIHKVDGLSDDQKVATQRDIQGELLDILDERGLAHCHPSFHLTSIYDHSILEAFSKVVQTLIPQRGLLESMLDLLISTCRIEKAFLFDMASKIYIATDCAPYDMQSYELCSEMIDVVVGTSAIYGASEENDEHSYDDKSFSVIKLSNGLVLCLREVDKHLGLVTMLREENFDKHGLLEYNFGILRQALQQAKRVQHAGRAE